MLTRYKFLIKPILFTLSAFLVSCGDGNKTSTGNGLSTNDSTVVSASSSNIGTSKNVNSPTINSSDSLKYACQLSEARARRDAQNDSLKYYFYSIAGPSKVLISKLQKANVKVVSLGCVVDKDLLCYNKITDSVVLKKLGVSINTLTQENVFPIRN